MQGSQKKACIRIVGRGKVVGRWGDGYVANSGAGTRQKGKPPYHTSKFRVEKKTNVRGVLSKNGETTGGLKVQTSFE